jgi:hypothetical protein
MLGIGTLGLGAVLGWLADVSAGPRRAVAGLLVASVAAVILHFFDGLEASLVLLAGAAMGIVARLAAHSVLSAIAEAPPDGLKPSTGEEPK